MTYERIDINEALLQLGGSEKLYRTLITGFNDKYQMVDEEIGRLLDEGRIEEARRLAHSLKGLSGNLGAHGLREKAKNLEFGIRDSEPDVTDRLRLFSEELKRVFAEVHHILSSRYAESNGVHQAPDHIGIEPTDEDGFIGSCRDLINALETYKYSEVRDAFARFEAHTPPKKFKKDVEVVKVYVMDYDYDIAIELVRDMINR